MDSLRVALPKEQLWNTLAIGAAIIWVVYGISLAVYRLFYSPLAKFPGPKLAALTQWYEVYFDIVHRGGGQFVFEIKRMHEKYGPIVRINPYEVHIDDPDYYDVLYSKRIDKLAMYENRFGMPLSVFSTVDADLHRTRRAAIAPYFSKNKVRDHGTLIQGIIDRVSYRLSTEWAGSKKELDTRDMWGSLTADVITEMAFARRKNFVEAPNMTSWFNRALSGMLATSHYMTHFPWLLILMDASPNWLVKMISTQVGSFIEYREEMEAQVSDVLFGRNTEVKDASHSTVFNEMLSSSLPPEELGLQRLTHEAMTVVGAGVHTTKWALTVATFYLLSQPDIQQRLKSELEAAIPDPTNIPSLTELEKLPYLTAVITEGLRHSFGGVARMPRVDRRSPMRYGDHEIPPGVVVSMDHYHMHLNPDVFPEPNKFKPERWLGNPKGPNGVKPLSSYMVAFGKGVRMCTGINLAYAELYIGLATIFRRHKIELFETDESDIEIALDLLSPMPKRSSKGVRVLVEK